MTPTTDLDRLVESWLRDAGPADIEPAAFETALDAARHTSQRRGPLAWLTGPGAWPRTPRRLPLVGDLPPAVRLAVVAGLLALAFGALALMGVGSSPGPSPSPGPTKPGVVVGPSPSATPLLGTLPCQSAAGFIGDVAASTGPVPSTPPSGEASTLLVKLLSPDGRHYELAELDPAQAEATPTRLIGIGGPGSELVPSPDGRAIALGVDQGLVFPCAEPVVISRAGDWYTVPFDVNRVGVVRHLAWSRDGGILYGIHTSNTDGSSTSLPADPGSVWAWDTRADTIQRLGSPCTGCALGDPTAGPDGTLAVAFTVVALDAPTCADASAEHINLECAGGGVAVLGPDGWRTATTTAQLLATAPDSMALTLLGWSDASTLVLGSVTTGVTRLGLDGTLTHVGFGTGCCSGSNDWSVLSPDGTTAALGVQDGDLVHSKILLTPVDGGPARFIANVVTSVRAQDGAVQGGTLGQPAWSPDSQTIAALLTVLTAGVDNPSTSVLVAGRDGLGLRQFALPIAGDPYANGPAPLAWLPSVR